MYPSKCIKPLKWPDNHILSRRIVLRGSLRALLFKTIHHKSLHGVEFFMVQIIIIGLFFQSVQILTFCSMLNATHKCCHYPVVIIHTFVMKIMLLEIHAVLILEKQGLKR